MTQPDRSFRKYIVGFVLSLFSTAPPFLPSTRLKKQERTRQNKNRNHFIIQDISFAEVATVSDGNAANIVVLQQFSNLILTAFQNALSHFSLSGMFLCAFGAKGTRGESCVGLFYCEYSNGRPWLQPPITPT
jgi:hypothetical protein